MKVYVMQVYEYDRDPYVGKVFPSKEAVSAYCEGKGYKHLTPDRNDAMIEYENPIGGNWYVDGVLTDPSVAISLIHDKEKSVVCDEVEGVVFLQVDMEEEMEVAKKPKHKRNLPHGRRRLAGTFIGRAGR